MARVFARIQAHPSRVAMHPALVASLAPLDTEVSLHASTPPNPWLGYRQALDFQPAGISHVLVVQDDATVCQNFAAAVTQVADANPDVPVCLFLAYLPRVTASAATRALKLNQRYCDINFRDFVPAIAVLWPVHKAQEMLAWTANNPKLPGNPAPRSDDAAHPAADSGHRAVIGSTRRPRPKFDWPTTRLGERSRPDCALFLRWRPARLRLVVSTSAPLL